MHSSFMSVSVTRYDYILFTMLSYCKGALFFVLCSFGTAVSFSPDSGSAGNADPTSPTSSLKDAPRDSAVSLDVIVVTARKSKEGSAENGYRHSYAQLGPMGEIPLLNIPFSVNVSSGESIENRSAHILADALAPNPAVVPIQQPHTDGRGGSELTIRGFDPCFLEDGLILRNTLPLRTENVDRLEVINGLSGFLYGFGTPGGTINIVRKQPVAEPAAAFSAGQYNGGVKFVNADCGGPATKGKRLTYRVNSYLEDGTIFNGTSSQRGSYLSGSLGLQPFDNSMITAAVSHQDLLLQGQQAAFIVDPARISVPSANDFDATRLYGQQWTYVKGRQDMFGGAVKTRLGRIISSRAAYHYSMLWRKNNGVSATLLDNSGAYRATYSDGAPADVYEHSAYALVEAAVNSWKVRHNITAGWMHNSFIQKNNPANLRNILIDTFTIAHPASATMPDTAAPVRETQRGRSLYNSAVFGDMLSYGRIMILAGANYTVYDYKNENLDTGLIKKFTQDRVSPCIALAVKPATFISAYASYTQGVTAGGYTTTAYAKNVNEVLSPSVHDQYEAGVKGVVSDRLDISFAGFRINKINEYYDPADSIYKQNGREIHQGVELTVTGKLFEMLTIGGGGTFMDARIVKAADKAVENKIPVNVPEKLARAYLEYEMPGISGVSVSAEANYNGIRRIDPRNTALIPSVFVYNAGFRFHRKIDSHGLTISLHVANLRNTSYWAAYKPSGTVGLCLGAPRTISLSAKYEW